jgi:hypothetical protein
VYTYNYAGPYADLLLPFYIQHKILQYIAYGFVDNGAKKSVNDWAQTDLFTYHYADLVVNVPDLQGSGLSIFPNPATDYIQVEGSQSTAVARVEFYNVSGGMVMNQVLDNDGRIPVSHLSGGIYVVRIIQGSEVKTGKVMIE